MSTDKFEIFSEEGLYQGTSKVSFQVDEQGTTHAFCGVKSFGVVPEKALDRFPLAGGEEKKLVLPCMPAAVPVVSETPGKHVLPMVLSRPLVKCDEKSCFCDHSFVALQSGRRSAILRASHGKFFRLKGCGDLNAGFPLIPVSSTSTGELQIRGQKGKNQQQTTPCQQKQLTKPSSTFRSNVSTHMCNRTFDE